MRLNGRTVHAERHAVVVAPLPRALLRLELHQQDGVSRLRGFRHDFLAVARHG